VADLVRLDQLSDEELYLVASPSGGVALADGLQAEGQRVLGAVLFLARPPQRDSMPQGVELLSL
jgi:hypothetical protein